MLSIRSVLFSIKSHLPANWVTSKGLRALFPSGYSGSISPLNNYVFFGCFQLAATTPVIRPPSFVIANCWFMADGTGRWFFGWKYGKSTFTSGFFFRAGFVFKSSVEGKVRGYIDRSFPSVLTKSCNSGTDNTIAQHWPQLFANGVRVFFQVVTGRDVVLSFVPINGSNVVCQAVRSGSQLFPFPTPSVECYVAAIVAAIVARALKTKTPVVADVSTVIQAVKAPSFPFPSVDILLEYLQTPLCVQVISDAKVIATQVFAIQSGQRGPDVPGAGSLSSLVTEDQIISAGTAANAVLTSSKAIPPITLWKELEALNA